MESLDTRVLLPSIPEKEVNAFVDIYNEEWGGFLRLTTDLLKRRLDSGNLFLGAYLNDKPVGFLETLALLMEMEYTRINQQDETYAKEVAGKMCKMIVERYPDYFKLTNNGRWTQYQDMANVLTLADINVLPDYRKIKIIDGMTIGGIMIDKVKEFLLLDPQKKPVQIRSIDFADTITPNSEGLKIFHCRNGAFDTEIVHPNFRRGYKNPDIRFLSYLAPGYKPQQGKRTA